MLRGALALSPPWKLAPLPSHKLKMQSAAMKQTTIIQNAPLIPVKPLDFFAALGAAAFCVVAIVFVKFWLLIKYCFMS